MVTRLALLGLAGAAGTLARYGVGAGLAARAGHPALATGVVNVVGCFLLGVAWGALDQRDLFDGDLRLVLVTGFLGAFTTFSALMYDTVRVSRDVSAAVAALNVGAQVVLGLLVLGVGVALGRLA